MKKLLTIILVLCTLTGFAQATGNSPYDPGAARKNLSNVDASATPSMTSITLSDKVQAAWANILGDVYASGAVKVGAGTAAAPAYTFSSDPDTGIYSAGANSIGFGVNGFKALTVAGIRSKIKAASDDTQLMLFEEATDDSALYISHITADVFSIGTSYDTTGSFQPLAFNTSDIERMRITSGGNVLIATSTDDGANKLQVNGNIKCNRIQYDEASIPIFADNAAAIGGGYPVGAVYRTSTGQLHMVYTP